VTSECKHQFTDGYSETDYCRRCKSLKRDINLIQRLQAEVDSSERISSDRAKQRDEILTQFHKLQADLDAVDEALKEAVAKLNTERDRALAAETALAEVQAKIADNLNRYNGSMEKGIVRIEELEQELLKRNNAPVIEFHLYECGHIVGKPELVECPICQLAEREKEVERLRKEIKWLNSPKAFFTNSDPGL